MTETSSPPQPTPGRWRVRGSRSRIGFKTRNFVGIKADGRFTAVDAAVEVADDPAASSIVVSIPVDSIDTGSRMRDRDLLKRSILDAGRWPELRFESTAIHPVGPGQFRVVGTLRIRDRTQPIELSVAAAGAPAGEYHYTATTRLNPRDFGIKHPFIRRDAEIEIDAWLVPAGA